MSTDPFSPEQKEAVTVLMGKYKTSIVEEVTKSISTTLEELTLSAKKEIESAVAQNKSVLIAKLNSKGESPLMKIAIALLPVLATVVLGFYLNTKIDKSKAEVTTRLAIQQEFYTRKLDTYEKVYVTDGGV